MRALCAFELALVPGHRRCRSRVLLLADVVLLRHLRRSEDVLLSFIHDRNLLATERAGQASAEFELPVIARHRRENSTSRLGCAVR